MAAWHVWLCNHPNRVEIEMAVCKGVAMHALGKTYGVSKDTIWRHCNGPNKHLSDKRRSELVGREVMPMLARHEKNTAEQLSIIGNALFDAFLLANSAGDNATVGMLSTKHAENAMTSAKLRDGIRQSNVTVNIGAITASPDYLRLVAVVLNAVRDHPEARGSIISAVRNFSDAAASAHPTMIEGEVLARE